MTLHDIAMLSVKVQGYLIPSTTVKSVIDRARRAGDQRARGDHDLHSRANRRNFLAIMGGEVRIPQRVKDRLKAASAIGDHVTFDELIAGHGCKWPTRSINGEQRFCNHSRPLGQSYCEAHAEYARPVGARAGGGCDNA